MCWSLIWPLEWFNVFRELDLNIDESETVLTVDELTRKKEEATEIRSVNPHHMIECLGLVGCVWLLG